MPEAVMSHDRISSVFDARAREGRAEGGQHAHGDAATFVPGGYPAGDETRAATWRAGSPHPGIRAPG
jgi:hypothetical protein